MTITHDDEMLNDLPQLRDYFHRTLVNGEVIHIETDQERIEKWKTSPKIPIGDKFA